MPGAKVTATNAGTQVIRSGVTDVGAIGRKYPLSPDLNYPVFGPGATAGNVDARRPILPGQLSRINLIQSIMGTD